MDVTPIQLTALYFLYGSLSIVQAHKDKKLMPFSPLTVRKWVYA